MNLESFGAHLPLLRNFIRLRARVGLSSTGTVFAFGQGCQGGPHSVGLALVLPVLLHSRALIT
jgi:hypothetical protein